MYSMAGLIADEVPDHMRRWSKTMRLGNDMNWEKHLDVMRNFLSQRPDKEREHIKSFFGTGPLHSLITRVNRAKSGVIRVEGVRSDTTDYVLLYRGIPAQLRAVPAAGYRFVRWEGVSQTNSADIQVTLDKNSEFRPYSSLLHPHKPVRWSLTRFIIILHLPRILMTGSNYTILMTMRWI